MTREEEIKYCADAFTDIESNGLWDDSSLAFGFEAGAKWADEHPKSPWIKMAEKEPSPENLSKSHYFLVSINENTVNLCWLSENDEYYIDGNCVDYNDLCNYYPLWMPILSKEL